MIFPIGPRAWIASASCLLAAAAAIRISAAPLSPRAPRQAAAAAMASGPTPTPQQVEFFEANIRPVLMDTCGECHLDDPEGDLRVDSRASLLTGGETGP